MATRTKRRQYVRGDEVRLSHTPDAVTGLVVDVLPSPINPSVRSYVVAMKNPFIDTADEHNRYTIQFLDFEELRPYTPEEVK